MSFHALAWASKQKTGGLATKSVLLALANYADEHGNAYPSTAAIAEFGEMDHKTATVALDRLITAGFIADTGERQGRTKQVKVYRLALESIPETEAFQKRKPSVSEPKAPQKRGTDTIKEPTSQKTSSSSRAHEKPDKLGFHRLPDDWEPKLLPCITAAKVSKWPPGKLDDELDAFRGWAANAKNEDGKGRKLNWDLAWVTWINRTDKDYTPNGNNRQPSFSGHQRVDGFTSALRSVASR